MATEIDNIKKIWDWFVLNQGSLFPEMITTDLINELDSKILSLGNFSWEIREGLTKDNLLIISPNGNVELLDSTKEIIKRSPNLPNWEFLHYKPAKEWDFKLSIQEDDNVQKIIDAIEWEYVLFKFSDGTYDIIIKADSIKNLPVSDKNLIADIVLESVLGEKLSLSLIKNIEFVDEFKKEHDNKKTSIQLLKSHIFDMETIS